MSDSSEAEEELSAAWLIQAASAAAQEVEDEVSDEKVKRPNASKKRKSVPRGGTKVNESCWWLLYTSADVRVQGSRADKKFRSLFSVPFEIFEKLVGMTRQWTRIIDGEEKPVFPEREHYDDQKTIPIAIKLMGTLPHAPSFCGHPQIQRVGSALFPNIKSPFELHAYKTPITAPG